MKPIIQSNVKGQEFKRIHGEIYMRIIWYHKCDFETCDIKENKSFWYHITPEQMDEFKDLGKKMTEKQKYIWEGLRKDV